MDEQLRYIPEPEHHDSLPLLKKSPEPAQNQPSKLPQWPWPKVILPAVIVVVLLSAFYLGLCRPPSDFPAGSVVTIAKGSGLTSAARLLSDSRIIGSPFAFKSFIVLFGGTKGLTAGDYYFESPQNAIAVAWRLSHARYDLKNIKVTIPEGFTVREIANVFRANKNFTHFNADVFQNLAKPHEGYLFPDTYFFLPNVEASDVVDAMLKNYDKRIASLKTDIAAFGRPEKDVITMASILEEEGRTVDTREMIAGILWKRLDSGFPLQVDASVVYASEKKSGKDLIPDDFKIDSPYNTYLHKGLPPGPISNPGLDAISATVHPISSKYLFYITDPQGGFHPAATYEEQLLNEQKYLGR